MPECDITKTGVTLELLETPQDARDAAWRRKFYEAVATASFRCTEPQVAEGPDGFPYFGLLSPEPFVGFESFCISNLLETLTENGLGVAINPEPGGSADWVFSYGDVLTLRLFQSLDVSGAGTPTPPSAETIEGGAAVLIGQPSETFLPGYCRRAIDRFLKSRGVVDPKVFVMHRASDAAPQQLVFSVFPEDFPSADAFRDALNRISWFLPRHYPVVAIERASDLARSFAPLWKPEPETSRGPAPSKP